MSNTNNNTNKGFFGHIGSAISSTAEAAAVTASNSAELAKAVATNLNTFKRVVNFGAALTNAGMVSCARQFDKTIELTDLDDADELTKKFIASLDQKENE